MGSIVSHSRIVQGKRKLALDSEDRTHFEHARPMELHPVDPETRGLLEGRHGNLNKIRGQAAAGSPNFEGLCALEHALECLKAGPQSLPHTT